MLYKKLNRGDLPKSRDWESPTAQSRKRKKKKTEISNDDRPQSFKKHICEKRKQTNTENLKKGNPQQLNPEHLKKRNFA